MAHDDHPTISTKEELLRRLRIRQTPSSTATLEPGGRLGKIAKRQTDEENRERISNLRNSLGAARRELEEQQVFARLSGFARAQFSNER